MKQIITREMLKSRLDRNMPTQIIEALPQKYFDEGHLPGAINIPHDQVTEKASEVLKNKDDVLVVYCASEACENSSIAAKALVDAGYTNVFEYAEGKKDWRDAGFSLE